MKASEWILLKSAVPGNAGSDFGMGELHQQRTGAPGQDDRLAVHAP